jgi:hypothetical protein
MKMWTVRGLGPIPVKSFTMVLLVATLGAAERRGVWGLRVGPALVDSTRERRYCPNSLPSASAVAAGDGVD